MRRFGSESHWLIITIGLYLVVVAAVMLIEHRHDHARALAEIDRRLLVVAAGVPHVLAEDFHDRATGPDAISPEEDARNQAALTDYARATGVRWVWTDIAIDGRFFLTACNRTEQSDQPGLETDYFVAYDTVADAERRAMAGEEPVFTTLDDRWGTFRAVFVPHTSPGGRRYLAAAEYELAHVEAELWRETRRLLLIAAALLLAVVPMFLAYRRLAGRQAARLAAANQELIRGRQRLATILDSIHEAVIATDAGQRIIHANPVAGLLLGRDPELLVGRALDDTVRLQGLQDQAPVTGLAARVRASGTAVVLGRGVGLHREDGKAVVVAASAAPIAGPGPDGEPAGVVAVLRDVTEQVRLDARLRQSQRLESVGRLAGGVAHDFNNLLMAILGSAELLAERLADHAELRDDVARIRTAGQRAAELTRQLLVFSRRQPPATRVVDLHEVVRETVVLLDHSLDRRIELEIRLDASCAQVRGDQARLGSALMNLAINARDAMPEGGTLTLRTANVRGEEGDLAGRDLVELTVADTGTGMSAEVRERVFEPFFSTKDVGQGTGLGMSVVYGAIRDLGGTIDVRSEAGQGTRLRILLPVVEGPTAAPSVPGARSAEGLRGRRVLLVEDEPDLRGLARRVLTRYGCEVEAAADGVEAEAVVRQGDPGRFDAVVLDLVMPRRDGPATFAVLRDLDPGLPVLVCSGYDASLQAANLLEQPATAYLTKPYDRHALAAALLGLLQDGDGARA